MREISWQTLSPDDEIYDALVLPQQTHSANIVEIVTGDENVSECDGVWSRGSKFLLGVKTADCAPIVFRAADRFGIIHCGWRGLRSGIIENMLQHFGNESEIDIGPLYPQFEIRRDFAYESLSQRFGEQFFLHSKDTIIFDFLAAIQSILPQARWCGINTYQNLKYASWRREGELIRERGQNITVVGRNCHS